MPITLNSVSGELDADIVDDNFAELEDFLKERVQQSDFNGKIGKFKIRRYTGGKIASFNTGAEGYAQARDVASTATFENNWIDGSKSVTFINQHGLSMADYAVDGSLSDRGYDVENNASIASDFPNDDPFELLGYPGGSLYYDFQEQGFPDPVSYYSSVHGLSCDNWPPPNSPLDRFPKDECWSRWLTVPDAAGSVYVDEPCVAVITAQVTGNYLLTPILRASGTNTSARFNSETIDVTWPGGSTGPETESVNVSRVSDFFNVGQNFAEGMQHSAYLRLGLFVDTNPIVFDDEFYNGNDYGNTALYTGHGFNPWIGDDPDGEYRGTKPSGVSKSRSWKKITDLSLNVRQKGTYRVVGVVELKGRRKYNFSLKYRPAMHYGRVQTDTSGTKAEFVSSYSDMSVNLIRPGGDRTEAGGTPLVVPDGDANQNFSWQWGQDPNVWHALGLSAQTLATWRENYFWPGGGLLATNLIESSALSVEFFYGVTLSSSKDGASVLNDGTDPATGE